MFLPQLTTVYHFDPDDHRRTFDVNAGLGLALLWSFLVAANSGKKGAYISWALGAAALVALYQASFQDKSAVDASG